MNERELFLYLTGIFTGMAAQCIGQGQYGWAILYQSWAFGLLFYALGVPR